MARKPNLTGGLTEDQAAHLEQILEQSGSIAEPTLLAEALDLDPKKVRAFLRTSRAQNAALRATDLSRTFLKEELNGEVEDEPEGPSAVPESQWELQENSLSKRSKILRGNSNRDTRSERDADRASTRRFIQRSGVEIEQSEVDYWNKVADGK